MNVDDMILVSVDDHICEPANMFDAHVPDKYKPLAPRVVTQSDGNQVWFYGDLRGRSLGLNAVAGKPRELYNIDVMRYDEMRPGCYDPKARIRDMDAGGQLAGLNFPNWTGFSGQVLNQGPDQAINLIMIQAYNDWHIDEWCATAPERFIPCGIVPLFDAALAAKEVRRLAEKGCHAVVFSENPAALNMPSIHSGYWDELYAACCETETVLCCHLGSSSQKLLPPSDSPTSVSMEYGFITPIFTLIDFIWAEFWTRFPKLRVALSEGGIGWIPYFLQRAEFIQDRHSGWLGREFAEGDGPRQVFERHLLTCFIHDPVGCRMLGDLNIDHVSWESDYPHGDTFWPRAPEALLASLEGQTDDVINKISYQNALRNYSFDPFRSVSPKDCTVSALRARATDVDTVTHVGRAPGEGDFEKFLELRGLSAAS
ncbi:MAG: amidohydrolase 2 [Acidimicrobiaceae bacterium]|nr:amidohydrolase 2 [Acidimicrobiaceae bacterium]